MNKTQLAWARFASLSNGLARVVTSLLSEPQSAVRAAALVNAYRAACRVASSHEISTDLLRAEFQRISILLQTWGSQATWQDIAEADSLSEDDERQVGEFAAALGSECEKTSDSVEVPALNYFAMHADTEPTLVAKFGHLNEQFLEFQSREVREIANRYFKDENQDDE